MNTYYIQLRPYMNKIILKNISVVYNKDQRKLSSHRKHEAAILRASAYCSVWPGDYIRIDIPANYMGWTK